MRIAIFGAGGVGGYFGGRLAQSGQDISFIARGKHLEALKTNGLKIDSIAGDFKVEQIQATDNPGEIGVVDYVLCCVKAWQVPAAAKAMKPMIGEQTLVIPLQNGVEAPGQLVDALGEDKVLGGLCAIITFQAGDGHIKHIGANPLIRFGRMDKHADPRVNQLSEVFNRCDGVKSSIPEDINIAMWQKFMLITAWSGIGAVTQAPIGVILQLEETRQMLIDALGEIYQTGKSQGVDLPENSVEKTMQTLQSFPENSTTSMQRDIAEGLPSELDVQTDAVVRLAREVGVDTPMNRFILHSLRPLELRARGALRF
ncbi:MAG: 2-dehydropantoate 2-reductase [Gammaproteobacteria bacterium]|nr:2-dehydropantoate 2-reductase [Gammaproteobacteria bacterium]